jgi:hypothetical protein
MIFSVQWGAFFCAIIGQWITASILIKTVLANYPYNDQLSTDSKDDESVSPHCAIPIGVMMKIVRLALLRSVIIVKAQDIM